LADNIPWLEEYLEAGKATCSFPQKKRPFGGLSTLGSMMLVVEVSCRLFEFAVGLLQEFLGFFAVAPESMMCLLGLVDLLGSFVDVSLSVPNGWVFAADILSQHCSCTYEGKTK
jgi:hypothetical protein